MTTELSLIPQAQLSEIIALDETIGQSHREIAEAERRKSPMLKALVTARAMQAIRKQLTPAMMSDVMNLMGSPLGFRTDRDKEGKKYDTDTVRDVLIVASLKGFRPVGNEFNIIAGNFYAAQTGMERVVAEFPGLSQLRLQAGVPVMKDGGALVPYSASWLLDGVKEEIRCELSTDTATGVQHDTRIVVRVNAGQGSDAILGKAKRKMLARIYERLMGCTVESAEDADTVDGEVLSSQPDPVVLYWHQLDRASTMEEADNILAAATEELADREDDLQRIRDVHLARIKTLADNAPSVLDGVHERIKAAKTHGQVKAIEQEVVKQGVSMTEGQILATWCDERCDELRQRK